MTKRTGEAKRQSTVIFTKRATITTCLRQKSNDGDLIRSFKIKRCYIIIYSLLIFNLLSIIDLIIDNSTKYINSIMIRRFIWIGTFVHWNTPRCFPLQNPHLQIYTKELSFLLTLSHILQFVLLSYPLVLSSDIFLTPFIMRSQNPPSLSYFSLTLLSLIF